MLPLISTALNNLSALRHKRWIAAFVLLHCLLSSSCTDSNHSPNSSSNSEAQQAQAHQNGVQDVHSAAVDKEAIIEAASDVWLSHGRTYSEQRHSSLTQINDQNVVTLGLAWSHDLQTSRGVEATPIVANGVIYVSSTWNIIYALNAKTGDLLWQFNPKIDKSQAAKGCCDAVNRGVAIWGDAVFMATLDGRLISLDAATGALNWDVNTIDKSKPYTITGAPRIIDGKVIIGNGGAEFGVRGYVSAYDSENGELSWRFYTVPGNPADGFESEAMQKAAKTWTGEWWQAGGGGTVWDSMAYDPDLDLLYIGVGNGSPWNHGIRSPQGGDNLFLSSIVALKPATGDYVWHYQTTPAETWDYTATQHMILADLEINGRLRKVIMQAPKNGFFYVLDRETGEFISANNFVPVSWASHIDPETGRPVETPSARFYGKQPVIQLPGPLGAHNWHPMSFSPDTGLVYIPAQEIPFVFGDDGEYRYSSQGWNTGVDFSLADLPNDEATFLAMKSAVKGSLLAWNPVKQEPVWSFEHGGPWNGGVLSTSGNVVFQGTADAHFAAYNALTGERLWRHFTQTGIVAAPITYEIDGEQYVAVASGWGGSYGLSAGGVFPTGSESNAGRLLVFKLGAIGRLPEPDLRTTVKQLKPKPIEVSEDVLALGKKEYSNRCAVCHGIQAVASTLVPNLRYSAITQNPTAWQQIVREGLLESKGMPDFSQVLDEVAAEAVRAYIINEANSGLDETLFQPASSLKSQQGQ